MPEGDGRSAARPIEAAEADRLLAAVFSGASGVLLAVSGGPDSMALMALAADSDAAPPLAVATVDHGLRSGSAAEAEAVAAAAASLGLVHATLGWTGPKPSSGIQEAAREARENPMMLLELGQSLLMHDFPPPQDNNAVTNLFHFREHMR